MVNVTFDKASTLNLDKIVTLIIVARYRGQWILNRRWGRDTWELPHGFHKTGETMDEAARRILWQETGAMDYQLREVCVLNASHPKGVHMHGMVYFADIHQLGDLPEDFGCEADEIKLFPKLPTELTVPMLDRPVFKHIQGWLNVQSAPGELWDVYDARRNLTGRTHRRGEELAQGDYHLVVHVWIQNSQGQFLMTRRSPNKGYPLYWESTGGSAVAGDDSLRAALREAKEETGLLLDPSRGQIIHSYSGEDYHVDVWLFKQDFDLTDVVLQEGETCDKRLSTPEQILDSIEKEEIVPYRYLRAWMETGCLLNLRKAASQDADTVGQLACLLWPEHPREEMAAEFAALLSREDAAVFLAEANGEPIGFAQCQLRRDYVEGTETSPVGYLEGIFVREEYRRKGIAKRLLKACESWAGECGCSEFASDCELANCESFRFHLALGFLEANRVICFTKKIGE